MQEYFEQKQDQERRIPAAKPVSETITISVAEYHFLTKAATLLEAIMHAPMHDRHALIEAAQKTIAFSEAGADQ